MNTVCMKDIVARLKSRRNALELSFQDLANLTGMSKSTLQRYESGAIKNIPLSRVEDLASALRTTPEYLMGWDSDEKAERNEGDIPSGFFPLPRTVKKPRLGCIVCGEPIDSPENLDGYDDVPENIRCDFTLKCEGDSMIGARIMDGDIVYIRQQSTADNGQIAAVCIGDEKTLKRVYWDGKTLILQPENPKYQPFVYTGEVLNDVRIIGVAVGFTSVIK